jgi:hypothetical protein
LEDSAYEMIVRLCSLHDQTSSIVSNVINKAARKIPFVQKITHLGVVAGV